MGPDLLHASDSCAGRAESVTAPAGFALGTASSAAPREPVTGLTGGPRRHPRSLRHFFASTALANGVLIHEVSRWLGHKSIKATVDIYSHLIPEAMDRYARSWHTRSDFVRTVTDWMCWISFDGAGCPRISAGQKPRRGVPVQRVSG
nr:tyrosine-type recombinase/integrase [Streptomyces brasiliscabiei]